jgi:YesN/AraC family two-component response regulator
MVKGLYHRKLIRIFVSIAMLFIVLFTILFCVLSISLIDSRDAALRTSVQSRFSLARTSLSVINYTMANLIGSSATTNWANEPPGTSEYYYRALKLYQELQHLTSQLDGREYEIAITSTEPDAFVVTKNGTRPRQWYFENEARISEGSASQVYQFFKTNKGATILPVYDKSGGLDTIIYALKASYYGHDLVFFAYIPAQTLFQSPDAMPYFLLGPNGSRIYSTNDQDTVTLLDRVVATLPDGYPDGIEEFNDIGHKTYLDRMPDIGITIGFVDKRGGDIDGWLFCLIIGIPALAVGALFAASYLTKRLYAPINDVIDTNTLSLAYHPETSGESAENPLADPAADQKRPVDEFAVIKNMGSRLRELTQELLEISANQQNLSAQQDYRLLLAGTTPTNEQDVDRYGIALFEVEESPADGYSYSLIALQANTSLMDDIECITLTPSLSAVIFRCAANDTADVPPHGVFMRTVQTLLDSIRNEDDVKVAVSDIVVGKHNVYRAYRQAQVILDYRRIYPGAEILTKDYVSSSESEDYYYPASVEQTFVNYALNGSQNAISLYDEIIKENTALKQLAGPTYQHFIFILSGTFLRIFQELKSSPEDIIGESIDWLDLYSQWNKPEALDTLRTVLVKIVRSVQASSSAEDDKLLEKMKGYIHSHYMYDIMLQDLAKKFNITPKYCSTLFKKLSNDTFKNYLNQYRIEQACLRIRQNPQVKISELSLDVGFNSSTSFIRVFNKYTGISPKAYADKIVAEET